MGWRPFSTNQRGDVVEPNLFDAEIALIRLPISNPSLRGDCMILFVAKSGVGIVVRASEVYTMRADGLVAATIVCEVRSSTIGDADRDLVSWVELQDDVLKEGEAPASMRELLGRAALVVECMWPGRVVAVCRAVEWTFESDLNLGWCSP